MIAALLGLVAALAVAPAPPLPTLEHEVRLPPTAERLVPDTLDLQGLTWRQALYTLAGAPLLDVNLIVTSRAQALDQPAEAGVRGLTAGQAFEFVVLQLTGTTARAAGPRTLVITDPGDRRIFGSSRSVTLFPLRALPSRVLAFLKGNEALSRRLDFGRITVSDEAGRIFLVGTEEEIAVVQDAVRLLDGEGAVAWGRFPLDFLTPAELAAQLERLAPEERGALPRWSYVETGRMVVARGDPGSLARLQDVIRAVDLPPGQVRLFLKLCQASSQDLQDLGLSIGSARVAASSLDALFRGKARTSAAAQVDYLLSRTRARTLASRTLLLLDRSPTTVHLGEIRNVRVQTATQVGPLGGTVVTQGAREVPLGLQMAIRPTIHHDGTSTLEIDFSEERALAVTEIGIDRTAFDFQTTVRARVDDPQLLAGFDQRSREKPRHEIGGSRRQASDELFLVLWTTSCEAARPSPSPSPSPPH